MQPNQQYPFTAGIAILLFLLVACAGKDEGNQYIAGSNKTIDDITERLMREFVLSDSLPFFLITDTSEHQIRKGLVKIIYESHSEEPLWSNNGEWKPLADSVFEFIRNSQLFGLFPEDYHFSALKEIRGKMLRDSAGKKERRDGRLWAEADVLLTDALVGIIKDIKLGRLPQDSITLRRDSILGNEFYLRQLEEIHSTGLAQTISRLEPVHRGYHELKAGIPKFIDSANYKNYTVVPYPEKNRQTFNKALQKRLYEEGLIAFDTIMADSVQLAEAVKKYQKKKGMVDDGKAGEATVRSLNVNDREKFIRIAISMDKYKMLPEQMPSRYIWVNVSSNTLELVERDKVTLSSKVICGKSKTQTPLLTSKISQLIIYPQWVPPPSIVSREILPAVKRNPGYLARKGFHLVDSKGNTVDPYSVNWGKYKSQLPYRIVQGSGDANALGVMKFVFDNKYMVYLHDTNQRYLFNSSNRSLSHGCVRVQEWEKLMVQLLRNDSVDGGGRNSYTKVDSVKSWLLKKERKTITLHNQLPLFIRYITCRGENGSIVFYDDVYGEDKGLRQKYFVSK